MNSYATSLKENCKTKNQSSYKKEPLQRIDLCDKFASENDLLVAQNLTMILFCFAGFLRFDEIGSLTFNNVCMHRKCHVLYIKKMKTD